MDIISRFKKKLEGAVAQVNPLDGGKTYSSVVNAPQPQQKPAPAPMPSIKRDTRNFVSRAFDQVNRLDGGRTYAQSTPTTKKSVWAQNNEILKNTVNKGADFGKSMAKPVWELADTPVQATKFVAAKATSNPVAANHAKEDFNESADQAAIVGVAQRWGEDWGKLGANTARGKVNAKTDILPIVGDAAEIASYGVGGKGAGTNVFTKTGAKEAGREIAQQSGLGFVDASGNTARDKDSSWADMLEAGTKGAGTNAAVGAAIPVAASVARATPKVAAKSAQIVKENTVPLDEQGMVRIGRDTPIEKPKPVEPINTPISRANTEPVRQPGADDYLDELTNTIHSRLPRNDARTPRDLRFNVEEELNRGYGDLISSAGDPKNLSGLYQDLIKNDANSGRPLTLAEQERTPAYLRDKRPGQPKAVPNANDLAVPAFQRLDNAKPAAPRMQVDPNRIDDPSYAKPRTVPEPHPEASLDLDAPAFARRESGVKLPNNKPIVAGLPERDAPAFMRRDMDAVQPAPRVDDSLDSPAFMRRHEEPVATLESQPVTKPTEHRIENTQENASALRSTELDRAIQEQLGTAGTTVQKIVDDYADIAGVTSAQAQKDVWRVAQESGYDIRDGFPVKRPADATPLSAMDAGAQTLESDLTRLDAATKELQAGAARGLTGVDHAVVIKESPFQRLHAYVDDKGDMRSFVTQKRGDGRWEEILYSNAPIKGKNDSGEIMRLMSDPDIQAEVARASQDGVTRQYIWSEDSNGLSAGLKVDGRSDPVTPATMSFDPSRHIVEGGFVRDKNTGEIVGNYVAVGPNGIQVQIGRQFISLNIDPSKLNDGVGGILRAGKSEGGNNKFNQSERWIEAIAKDKATQEQLRNIVVYPAREAEANMKVEAKALGEGIRSWRKEFNKVSSPAGRKAMQRDAVYVLEPDAALVRKVGRDQAKRETMDAFRQAHGDKAASVLADYEQWMRAAYDNLLERMNTVRRHNGMDEIPRRQDYITHIQEMNTDVGQIYQSMRDGIFGDVDGTATRGRLPEQIAGRTEDFKPIQKYNPFTKARSADGKPLNPFEPLATYAGVALHNIHLTKPAAMTRSLELGLRAAKEFASNRPAGLEGAAAEQWDKIASRFNGNYSDSIEWLTEHANLLAGKSSSWNRQLLKSEGGRQTLKVLNFMQRQTGRANILGNASSVVAQSLNLPSTIGTNGVQATSKAITRSLAGAKANAAWRKSNFMRERYTDASNLASKTALEKVLKPLGIPLGVMEKAFVHLAWNSSYEKALSRGLSGDAAIRAADTTTSKIVAGRSIGDSAHIYQSTLTNVPLQFTREVTESWKNFTKDQSVYGKALTLIAASGMNYAMNELTGRSPLPDPLSAAIETVHDFMGAEDDGRSDEENTIAAKAGRAVQRGAETVASGVPIISSVANQLPQDTRKVLFGSESDLGRYEGTLALLSPAQRLMQATQDLFEGELTSAGQNAVAALPGGAQARKTWQGAQTMANGEAQNASGAAQTDVDNSDPLKVAQALLFGKNAVGEVKDYYASGNSAGGGSLSGAAGKALETRQANQEELNKRLEKLFSKEDNTIRKLSPSDREYLLDAGVIDQEKIDGLERYELDRRKELGLPAGDEGQYVPKPKNSKLTDDIKKFYRDRSYVYDSDLDGWHAKPAEGSAKDILKRADGLAGGRDPLPQNNKVAELYADFAKKRGEEKWGKTKENNEKFKFLKAAYNTELSPEQKEWYGLSDASLRAAIDNGEVGEADFSELIAHDDRLRGMGLYGEIGNGIRRDYGFRTWSTSSGSGSRKGGGRGSRGGSAKIARPPASFFSNADLLMAFQKIMSSARL